MGGQSGGGRCVVSDTAVSHAEMKLATFKTLWGHPNTDRLDSLVQACGMAVAGGFQGIEGPVPVDEQVRVDFAALLEEYGLHYIAEICTAGSYVPDRTATVRDHLVDLERQLKRIDSLTPAKVNCIGGCDRWSLDDSLCFFSGARELAAKYGQIICFETHRGRSLYSPWATAAILEQQALPLTCDFSHWCVVCEGLGDSEAGLIRDVARYAQHIHGRIGYDQGPQVSDPASPLYRQFVDRHLAWWSWIWQAQAAAGISVSTFTPEFGPDGYQMVEPRTGQPVGDLNHINRWMAERAATAFNTVFGEIE
jgi:hypothetical protein